MKLCKTHLVLICLFFLATVPAYCQKATLGLDFGQTSDRFGGLSSMNGAVGEIEGEVVILHGGGKGNWPSLVGGGEIRFPTDTQHHADEYAVYGGPMFRFGSHFSAGFHVQVRKILVPPSYVNGVVFNRLDLKLLELPFVAEYKFSTAPRHAFLRAEISPEFTPHYQATVANYPLPNPSFDHGYDIRGSVGYVFGKWYAKATYETRYFKFEPNLGNPSQIYNWRTNLITGGVGYIF
ncbi:MAG: hypothetical protein ACLQBK_23795 [Candidatus Sulfotelmatobacter sp.]